MDIAAPHIGFVISAYALSAVLIVGLLVYVIGRDRNLRREANRLERPAGSGGQR